MNLESSPTYVLKYAKNISCFHQHTIDKFDAECKKIWAQRFTMQQFMDNISDLVTTYEQEASPFFLVDDCGKDICVLARCNNPYLRQTFEIKASLLLREKTASMPDRPINYVSLCPTGTFSELNIIARTLLKYPTAHINVSLVSRSH